MPDAADLAALRQHWRALANLAARAERSIARRLDRMDRYTARGTTAYAGQLQQEAADQWRHIRQVTVLCNVLAARIGPDPTDPGNPNQA